jgi:site-specific recombinase XerC
VRGRVDRRSVVLYRNRMQRLVPEPEQCLALASIEGEFDAMVFNAVFAMLYGTGMLLRELLGLRLMDVLAGERTRIEIGGFRARTLPLPKGAADRLALVLGAIGARPSDLPIFGAAPISIAGWAVAAELKRRSLMLGFARPLGVDDLKIAFARHLAERQTPLEIIAEMMGYKSMNSLQKLLTVASS